MPTTKDTAELLALQKKLAELSPADRLRLCAELVSVQKYDIAETLIDQVLTELRAVRLLRRKR